MNDPGPDPGAKAVRLLAIALLVLAMAVLLHDNPLVSIATRLIDSQTSVSEDPDTNPRRSLGLALPRLAWSRSVAHPLSKAAQPPRPISIANWIRQDDYPPISQRDEEEGVVEVRLRVDPDGQVVTCTITATSGWTELDQQSCQLLGKRARFAPALDEKGRAVSSDWTQRVRWQLPHWRSN